MEGFRVLGFRDLGLGLGIGCFAVKVYCCRVSGSFTKVSGVWARGFELTDPDRG